MLKIEGYTIGELLDDGPRSAVYRAWDDRNQRPVVIKTFSDAYPSAEVVARMEHEFDIGKDLRAEHVVTYYELVPYGSSRALVLEDFSAESLASAVARQPLALVEWLQVASGITRGLGELHARDVVHRDVSPGNILWNRQSGEVKIADLGLATRIPRSKEGLVNPGRLHGTLAYISPEQTGRMNRAVDFRTDFYSLGATLWFALTGAPPYVEGDAMAVIHAHIAKAPPDLRSLRNDVPKVVTAIVHRLLAKTAEERYQSAEGLSWDLERCAQALDSSGSIESFPLGQRDGGRRFRISEKLYGREAEVAELLDTFERVGNGSREILLVRGLSGIGKSMLVNEVHKPMVARRAYFAGGKYDQLGMTDPLSGLLQALRDLVRQLLSEDDEVLASWREAVLLAVGDNARVLTDLIPELAGIIGVQPDMLQLGAVESRERFERTLVQFIQGTATADHPLVLFLDDVQWVDPASLRVLSQLVLSRDSSHTLVICAYRENEVPASHPFALALNKIEEEGVSPSVLTLGPLTQKDLQAFIGDSLDRDPSEVKDLAEVVLKKTGGNPFHVTQLLRRLADGGMVEYNDAKSRWEWRLDRIAGLEVVESVVDLMADRIEKYGEDARALLSLASCMGNEFDLGTLAVVADGDPRIVARGLWEPVRDGLVVPVGPEHEYFEWSNSERDDAPTPEKAHYRFAHDRIQQAAYRGIAEGDTGATHLRIGRLLLDKAGSSPGRDRIFDVVNHLNLGRSLIDSEAERHRLAQLNLEAARAAVAATAFDGALEYTRTAMALLPDDSWDDNFDLTYQLHRERISGELLAGNWDEATAFFEQAMERAVETAHIAELYQLMLRILLQSDRVVEATEFGIAGCRALGLDFPEDPDAQAALVAEELQIFDRHMAEHSVDDLLNRPLTEDRAIEELLGVLHETWAAAVMSGNGNVVVWTALKTVTLALEHGNSVFTSAGYVGMTLVLSLNKRFLEADAIGRMAMELARRFDNSFLIPKVNNTYCNFTNHFVHHMRECLPIYEESYRHALLGGDTWWGAWAAGWLRVARLVCGFPLDETLATQEKFHDYIVSSAYKPLEFYSHMDRQIVLNLMGRTIDPLSFSSHDYDESQYLEYFEETGFGLGLHLHWIYKALVHWMNGAHDETPRLLDEADKHVDFIRLTMPWIDHYFFSPLCAAQHVGSEDSERDAWAREKIQAHLAQLREWEETGKENFRHRAALVEAEWQRVNGRDAEALVWYHRAIDAAKEHGYVHHEAMANELLARHHLAEGREQAALGYILEAHRLYSRWGARGKVRILETEFHRELRWVRFRDSAAGNALDAGVVSTSRSFDLEAVDLNTVLKASTAISGELNLARLIERLMGITMENAGAQKGVLLLEHENGTTVEALASVDRGNLGVLQGTPLAESRDVPHSVIAHVRKTNEALVLADAENSDFAGDPYVKEHGVRSVMCLPVVKQQKRLAVLYMQNDRATAAFAPDRVAVLQMICTEAAVAIENARLYDTLEQKVEDRTRELAEKNAILEDQNEQIMVQQTMLVHSEKMASLGQLVAGVAHELNNPINFISSGLPSLERDLNKLAGYTPQEDRDRQFEKILARINKLLRAIEDGASRTSEIVRDLRSFSRLDEADFKSADLHEAIDATLTLLRSRIADSIEVVKRYGDLPDVYCAIGQINQVMMNILTNAIQSMGESGTLTITTSRVQGERVQISIRDTGTGIDEAVRAKIFDPFYTTKDVGEGTGLGLSISHGLIERHQGTIEVHSELGEGSEFIITIPIHPKVPEGE